MEKSDKFPHALLAGLGCLLVLSIAETLEKNGAGPRASFSVGFVTCAIPTLILFLLGGRNKDEETDDEDE